MQKLNITSALEQVYHRATELFSSITIHRVKKRRVDLLHFRRNCFSNRHPYHDKIQKLTHKLKISPNLVIKSLTRLHSKSIKKEKPKSSHQGEVGGSDVTRSASCRTLSKSQTIQVQREVEGGFRPLWGKAGDTNA